MGAMRSFNVVPFRSSLFCSLGNSKHCGMDVSLDSSSTVYHCHSHDDGLALYR